nr:hypothetical protein Cduv_328 [Cedratvirus duvanny]
MQPEILVAIIKEMEIKDILRMSLVFSELFDEGMWRMLTKYLFFSDWDYYSFLEKATFSPRKRFAQIVIRKSFLPASTVTSQVWFALLNQRKDLIQVLCKEQRNITAKICWSLSYGEHIYFNRYMVNYALSILGYMIGEREMAIAKFKPGKKTSLNFTDRIRMNSLSGGGANTCDEEFLKENSNELCFFVYSVTREKELLSKLLNRVDTKDIAPATKRNILCNLYRSNYLDLAKEFEQKYSVDVSLAIILSCLADYYLNTGDDKGLYESLSLLQEQGLLLAGSYQSKIFELELEEVTTLLKKNRIFSNKVAVKKVFT